MTSSKCLLIYLTVFLLLTGCATATYQKPIHTDPKEKYELILNEPYDDVWKNLIQYSAKTFFGIENYEKDSGLITLSFGASEPERFITGGQWKIRGVVNFDGDYVEFMSVYRNGKLTGKMNIVVVSLSQSRTKVIINARYVFDVPRVQNNRGETWTFDTGSCATVRVANKAPGTSPTRTVCPTYAAENAIIEALK